jgi:hypothetical protein
MAILFKKGCLVNWKRCYVTPHKTICPECVDLCARLPQKIDNVFNCRWSFVGLSSQAELNGFLLFFQFNELGPTSGKGIVRMDLVHGMGPFLESSRLNRQIAGSIQRL